MLVANRVRPLDADLAAYINANLPIGYSYETLLAIAQATAYILEGGNDPRAVQFAGSGEVLTDMAAAATLLRASPASAKRVDLTQYTQARIVCIMGGVAGPAGAKCIAKFKATLGANDAAYAALGVTAIEAAMDTADTAVASAWINLATAAKADVYVAVSTSGGDGAVDPVVGSIEVQFR